MRAIQAMWPRLKVPLPTDSDQRADLIETIVRLHNLTATYVPNHNQVQTCYLEAFLRA